MVHKELETLIERLRAELGGLDTVDADLIKMLKIIRRPGWTTPAESTLVEGILESMIAQVKAVKQLGGALTEGSSTVGQQ